MEHVGPAGPTHVGPFKVVGVLGQGGMGRVLLGAGPDGRLVAVKQVLAHYADDEGFRARFRREVAASRKVSGAYTAAVMDADADAPTPWLASVFVAGPSLGAVVEAAGVLPEDVVRRVAAGLASALAEIHRAGLVHRDLKPDNVLLAEDGVRVIDLGIARAAGPGAEGDTGLTRTGWVVGSPAYMSPEQAEGKPLTPASDVFSLGSVLVMAVTGRSPFAGSSTLQTLYDVVHAEPDLAGLPAGLRGLVERCLAKDPAARPSPGHLRELIGPVAPAGRQWPAAVYGMLAEQRADIDRLLGEGPVDLAVRAGEEPPPATGDPAPRSEYGLAAERGLAAETGPVAERVLGAESGLVAERVLAAESGLVAQSGLAAETGPVAESGLAAGSGLVAQSGPVAESAPAAGSCDPAPGTLDPARGSGPRAGVFGSVPDPGRVASALAPGQGAGAPHLAPEPGQVAVSSEPVPAAAPVPGGPGQAPTPRPAPEPAPAPADPASRSGFPGPSAERETRDATPGPAPEAQAQGQGQGQRKDRADIGDAASDAGGGRGLGAGGPAVPPVPGQAPRGAVWHVPRRVAALAAAGVLLVAAAGTVAYVRHRMNTPIAYTAVPTCQEAGRTMPLDLRSPTRDTVAEDSRGIRTGCNWDGLGLPTAPAALVRWDLALGGDAARNAAAQRERFRVNAAEGRKTSGLGLGTEAYWGPLGLDWSCVLAVREGNLSVWVGLQASSYSSAACETKAKEVARAAFKAATR
ncbi:serine/threonine-protein kinase [Streptomyces sp. CB00455]|uniref:serine/threonine-protein kinase n=1 Tax=Streptomyces sp. CB00455 TaxID=1703927 RepID=UPI00094037D9|nr:serine/threonine-protein kinase [Streptomyces sp. CB00455]